MRKVLFITRHYLSDNNGGSNATKGFVHALARLYDDLWVIYSEHDGEDSSSFVPSNCHLLPCYDHRSKVRKGLDVYRGRLHRLTDYVRDYLRESADYDIIVLDHSVTAASILGYVMATGAKIVTIHHNVERDYLKDNMPSLPYRFPMLFFSKKAERDALLKSDLNFTLTKKDADTFQSWYPGKDLHLHDVGICEYRGVPDKSFEPGIVGTSFVISGSLCFKQSLEPIVDFVRNYYPVMRDICPGATLIIAGRNPSEVLYRVCEPWKDIRIVPNPKEMSDIINEGSIYVSPICAGSGIKLRVMDGLREGKPVICHRVSAYGYEPLVKAGFIHEYDDAESFKAALRSTVGHVYDPNAAYKLFQSHFSVANLAERIEGAMNTINGR